MSSVEEVRERLIQSELLRPDVLQRQIAVWSEHSHDTSDGASLVDFLVEKELLTEFQGEAILAGHAGPFMLGPYRVYEQVAAGRLGGVFRAVHTEFDQPVSLKVFPASLADNPEKLARMGRELRVAVSLDHPNVVRSFQIGKIGPTYYLAFEDLAGETLAARLERDGKLAYADACRIARDVARGLSHLHANEIVHRDVRPANIWLSKTGLAKIMEFGAARDSLAYLDASEDDENDELTSGETVIGEYDYMSPEQAHDAREAGPRADLYSLGCALYHCIAGRPPFTEKNPVKQVLRHANDPPQPIRELVPEVPHQLDETLAGMLAEKPEDRFPKAEDVVFALEPFAGREEVSEQVVVVDVSPEYLAWVQGSKQEETTGAIAESAVAVTPELTEFLDWMSSRQRRKKKRR